jgi:hypothetical protein
LEKREFKKYFLELLEFFGDDKQKGKLVKWNEYNSILDYEAKIIIQNAPPISKIEMLSFYLLNYISDAR